MLALYLQHLDGFRMCIVLQLMGFDENCALGFLYMIIIVNLSAIYVLNIVWIGRIHAVMQFTASSFGAFHEKRIYSWFSGYWMGFVAKDKYSCFQTLSFFVVGQIASTYQ